MLPKESEELEQFESLKNSEIFKTYKYDINELLKIKVDLTFSEPAQKPRVDSNKKSVDWAKEMLEKYPEIKPIVHVLKRYLQIKKLNSSFNGNLISLQYIGGLSSFSLFLLISAYIKYPKVISRTNLGRILVEFLELFGKHFDYSQTIIDVDSYK